MTWSVMWPFIPRLVMNWMDSFSSLSLHTHKSLSAPPTLDLGKITVDLVRLCPSLPSPPFCHRYRLKLRQILTHWHTVSIYNIHTCRCQLSALDTPAGKIKRNGGDITDCFYREVSAVGCHTHTFSLSPAPFVFGSLYLSPTLILFVCLTFSLLYFFLKFNLSLLFGWQNFFLFVNLMR